MTSRLRGVFVMISVSLTIQELLSKDHMNLSGNGFMLNYVRFEWGVAGYIDINAYYGGV